MAPLARLGLRTLQTLRPLTLRQSTLQLPHQTSKNFSILSRARALARSFEPHPFGRVSVQSPARPDYAKLVRRVGDAAQFYFPWFAVVLGWPYAAYLLVDGHL